MPLLNNTSVVQGTSVTFAGTGTDPEDGVLTGASLVWTSSINGQIGTGTTFATSALSVGPHTITLTSKDHQGLTGTASITLTVTAPNQAPTAAISAPANNSSVVQGASVTFTGTGTDPEDGTLSGASLVWTSNINGQIGTGTTFSTTALSVGQHTITLTAKDHQGLAGTATITLTVTTAGGSNQPPVATYTYSCPTLQCTMDATTSTDDVGIVKYTWDWGNGKTESHTTPVSKNTWSTPGTYTVTLTVTDGGGLTNSTSKSIAIPTGSNQPPTAAISAPANNTTVVQGTNVTFTGSGSDPEDGTLAGASLVWTSSINGQIGTGTSFSTTALAVGTHTITLTAKDHQGVAGTASITVTVTAPVNQPPTASISAPANNTSVVQGTNVTFTGSGTDPEDGTLTGASLVWTSNINGQIGTGTSFATTALSVGTHTITLTARDHQGLGGSATITLTVTAPNQPPTASISAPANNTSAVQGTNVTFTGSGSDPEDGSLSGASLVLTQQHHQPGIGTGTSFATTALSVGTHTITLTAKDHQGLTGTASITVTITAPVNQPPTASISAPANNTSVVQGTSVAFTGSGNDPEDGALTGSSLAWTSNINGQIGTGTSFSTTTLSVGTHTITLTSKDHQGLTGTASITLTITAPNQAPTALISAPANNTSVVQGTNVSFTGGGSDPEDGTLSGASLVWTSNINGQIGTGTSFSTTTLSVGTHTITLTAKDHQGLAGTATITLTITAPTGNQPPVAKFTWTCPGPTHQCTLDATTSTDDVGIVKYAWDWGEWLERKSRNGDGEEHLGNCGDVHCHAHGD